MLSKCGNRKHFHVLSLEIGDCLDKEGQSGLVLDVVPEEIHPLCLYLPAKYAPVNIAVFLADKRAIALFANSHAKR